MGDAVGRDRRLGQVCVTLFAGSSLFPAVAGVLNLADPPLILGVADIVVAAMLVTAAILVDGRTRAFVDDRHRAAAYGVSRKATAGVLVLLALFLLGRPRIRWDVLVTGLAWRGWLLLYVLPGLLALRRKRVSGPHT